MQTSASQSLEIQHESDVSRARQAGKITAGGLGFEPEACEEIALVMIELATNLLKHARGGSLTLTPLGAGGRVGLEIESRDSGPGIDDIEQALADRFSTAGSRGTGLGAVNRLMDEMEITSRRGSGTRIVSRKWVRAHQPSGRICPLAVGVATRPCGGCTLNGVASASTGLGKSGYQSCGAKRAGRGVSRRFGPRPVCPPCRPDRDELRDQSFRPAARPDFSRYWTRLSGHPRGGDGPRPF